MRGRPAARGFYVVVEKILAEGEQLPRFAGVAGTTGYEWLNVISRFLLDWRGLDTLDRAWREASGDIRDFEQVLAGAKRRVLGNILASEFTVLTRLLARIAAGHYSDARLFSRAAASRAGSLRHPISRFTAPTSRPPVPRRTTGRSLKRPSPAHARSGLARTRTSSTSCKTPSRSTWLRPAAEAIASRACAALPSRCSNSPGR